ncbi:MAG: hypothetical protein IJJ69_01540 [Oscillospiraceae bacterium]|nr:hypothetical protein [Oscillospiraceae bacterium]
MIEHKKINRLDDFFCPLNQRREKGVYFYRINGCNPEIREFIRKYYNASRQNGVVIEGGIANPTNQNLAYYQEQMGTDFQMSLGFLESSLKKWLPRMNDAQRQAVSASVYHTLDTLRKNGKPESVLKNVYIKFMCWLYYKFERIVSLLGNDSLPKMLYEGTVTNHELLLISVLAHAGCDVVLLQYQGDADYLKYDADSKFSENLSLPDMKPFPEGYSLKTVRQEMQDELNRKRLYGTLPDVQNCTNAWLSSGEKLFEEIKTTPQTRGDNPNLFYNLFCRIEGVEQKQSYPNLLYQLYDDLKTSGRPVVALDTALPEPSPAETNAVIRGNQPAKIDNLIMDFLPNLKNPANIQLERLAVKSFVDVMLEESRKDGMNLNKLSGCAVHLICWFRTYQPVLFRNWKMPEVSSFLYLGGCRNEKEALFFRFLSRLPVDIFILTPDLTNQKCCLQDDWLYAVHYDESLDIAKFPTDISQIRLGTTAYHAERELDTLLYQDSGIYRNQQYAKANPVTLQTTFEEISLYWKEEVNMRPNFMISHDTVVIPVIFAKISGVKDSDVPAYLNWAKELMAESPFVIQRIPYIGNNMMNPFRNIKTEFLMNGQLQRDRIKNHKDYKYGFLRNEIQEHMLDKLQLLLDQRIIKGTFENQEIEYKIVSVALNLDIPLIREIQKFDFTKKNPKLLYVMTGENMPSLEDAIIMAFLNLLGFDIVFLVPTGYQCVERFYQKTMLEEHQTGEYLYNIKMPNLQKYAGKPVKTSPFSNLFKKRR